MSTRCSSWIIARSSPVVAIVILLIFTLYGSSTARSPSTDTPGTRHRSYCIPACSICNRHKCHTAISEQRRFIASAFINTFIRYVFITSPASLVLLGDSLDRLSYYSHHTRSRGSLRPNVLY